MMLYETQREWCLVALTVAPELPKLQPALFHASYRKLGAEAFQGNGRERALLPCLPPV